MVWKDAYIKRDVYTWKFEKNKCVSDILSFAWWRSSYGGNHIGETRRMYVWKETCQRDVSNETWICEKRRIYMKIWEKRFVSDILSFVWWRTYRWNAKYIYMKRDLSKRCVKWDTHIWKEICVWHTQLRMVKIIVWWRSTCRWNATYICMKRYLLKRCAHDSIQKMCQ